MKSLFPVLLLVALLSFSCQEDPKIRAEEQKKEAQKSEIIFNTINKAWNFNTTPINPTAKNLTNGWTEWRLFLFELSQKPKTTIGAFQQKAKTLAKRAYDLTGSIPMKYCTPEVKSRISVLITKCNMIDLYIHLGQIQDKKIVALINEINIELISLERQLDEIEVKSKIKMEDGENDMLKMLDTNRAIPNPNTSGPNSPR